MLVIIPSVLGALFVAAGAGIPVWKLDTGSEKYSIAAQGYKVDGGSW